MPAPPPTSVSTGPSAHVDYKRTAAFPRMRIHSPIPFMGPSFGRAAPRSGADTPKPHVDPSHPLGMS